MTILPGDFDDPLQIEINNFEFDRAPKYTALSYCWGDGPIEQRCLVKSQGYLNITSNLYEALQRCKRPMVQVHVWADQISIDQKDDVDKVHQIRLMGKIYSQAHDVVVWLGTEDPETRQVFNVITTISKDIYAYIKGYTEKKDRIDSDDMVFSSLMMSPEHSD